MTNESFETWRSELHAIQIEIDELDETFWGRFCDVLEWDEEAFQKAEAQYTIQRDALCKKLNDHSRKPA
ncbi:hypothetical protein SEA_TANIS_37 [Gordonia phage Tanis]|nr:hypothetical protein HWC73_gp37 [Gordonia phage Tanis]QFP95611.1 hypothetical protein SEA_TANIS_37 [Gordonia phage Tanis]QKY78709.1 hypothetical protein SEA_GILL_37 [Gordonia phage Gill]QLF83754.1 hypothetical protein SEA_MAGEL_38 [Gordonia phage Magel]QYW00676.1 hypothetical protein SEA_RONEY_37 [Gordonia phage Roney]